MTQGEPKTSYFNTLINEHYELNSSAGAGAKSNWGPVQRLQYETLLFWWEETKKDGCLVMSVEVGILAYED